MIFALGAPVLAFAVGMAVDYTNHTIVESKLRAAADAAALAALTPAMLQQTPDVAKAAATAMFNARASAVTSLVAGVTQVSVDIQPDANNPLLRVVTVNYSGASANIFAQVLNVSQMNIVGTSTAKASVPPNINFYLLLDNSPSMQLPATSDGITAMQNATSMQEGGAGCAFACHQASTNNGDTQGNLCSTGGTSPLFSTPTLSGGYCDTKDANGNPITQIDNFAQSRKNNIVLRLDELSAGVTTLMQTANKYQSSGLWSAPPTYQFAAYEMDLPWTVGTTNNLLMSLTPDYQNVWNNTASKTFGVMEMFANNSACADPSCASGVGFADTATNYDVAMNDINSKLPDPGYGSNQPGDKPQVTLFFVTDGVEDETAGGRLIQTINAGASTNYCSQIKARGIKIAVLYTEYLQVPANSFYQANVAHIQPDIGTALQACATKDLYVKAAIGDDLGTALTTLFQLSVQSATISN